MRRRAPSRGLTTLLFTDVANSSEVAVELGDRRWRVLQARHHAEVRRHLKAYGGHEVDTAGDGFFATFKTPAAGVRCSFAIVEGVREIGLEIRAGLHIGEVELSGEKVGGIAVTTAARVAALADPGQVLVTSTIVQMVGGSGLTFMDVAIHELKGVPGTWELYRLAAVDDRTIGTALDANDSEVKRRGASPIDVPPRKSRVALSASGMALLVIAIVTAIIFHRSSTPTSPETAPSQIFSGALVVKLDAATGTLHPVVDIPAVAMDVPAGPIVLTPPAGLGNQAFAWVVSVGRGTLGGASSTLSQLDRATTARISSIRSLPSCISPAPCLVTALGRIWFPISQNQNGAVSPGVSIEGIDMTGAEPPSLLPVTRTSELSGVSEMVWGNHAFWIGDTVSGTIYKVGLAPGDVSRYRLGGGVDALAFGEGGLWVIDGTRGRLERFDPAKGRVTGHTQLSGDATSVAVGRGFAWVTDATDDLLERFPVSLEQGSDSIPVGDGPFAVVFDDSTGVLWVANRQAGTVMRIDPTSEDVTGTYPVGIHPTSIAVDADEVWTAGSPGGIDRS